jgi:hypothetical protein
MSEPAPTPGEPTIPDAAIEAYDGAAVAAAMSNRYLRGQPRREAIVRAGLAAAEPILAEQWRRERDVCGDRPGDLLTFERHSDHVHACGRIPGHRHPEHECHGCLMTWHVFDEPAAIAAAIADLRARFPMSDADWLRAVTLPDGPDGRHLYLSTGCLHGDGEHCRSDRALSGDPKQANACKFCPAQCVAERQRPVDPDDLHWVPIHWEWLLVAMPDLRSEILHHRRHTPVVVGYSQATGERVIRCHPCARQWPWPIAPQAPESPETP